MAVIVSPDGKKLKHHPANGKIYTIGEISKYVNGLVQPTFTENHWIFFNLAGSLLQLPYNSEMSKALGINIYGTALIIEMSELPCQFFMPDDSKEANDYDNSDKIIKDSDDIPELDKNFIYVEAYKNLIESNIDFSILNEKFILYTNEFGKSIFIPKEDIESKLEFLNNMIKFFSESEEYEKCSELNKLLHYIEEQ